MYSLLSMLGTHDKDDMSQTLLAMSNSQDSCVAMRQSGTIFITLIPVFIPIRFTASFVLIKVGIAYL